MNPVRAVARVFLSAVFIRSGIQSLADPDRVVETAKPVTDQLTPTLERLGLPTDPRTLVRVNAAAQVAGGALLATGQAPRSAALLLAGSMVPTTLAGHRYWEHDDPALKARHRTQFLKNLGLIGGLLLAALDTEGRPGVVWRAGHAVEHAQDSLDRVSTRAARETRRAAKRTRTETTRVAQRTTAETRRAAKRTAAETRRAAHRTAVTAKRAAEDARRSARAAARETKIAASNLGLN